MWIRRERLCAAWSLSCANDSAKRRTARDRNQSEGTIEINLQFQVHVSRLDSPPTKTELAATLPAPFATQGPQIAKLRRRNLATLPTPTIKNERHHMRNTSIIRTMGLLIALTVLTLSGCQTSDSSRSTLTSFLPTRYLLPRSAASQQEPWQPGPLVAAISTPNALQSPPVSNNPSNGIVETRSPENAVPLYSASNLPTMVQQSPAYSFGPGSTSGCNKGCCSK